MVAKLCSGILGYQLHHFPYRLNIVYKCFLHYYSAEKQKTQMWLKDMCKATPIILCNQKQQQLTDFPVW